jgi:hypothetical protein
MHFPLLQVVTILEGEFIELNFLLSIAVSHMRSLVIWGYVPGQPKTYESPILVPETKHISIEVCYNHWRSNYAIRNHKLKLLKLWRRNRKILLKMHSRAGRKPSTRGGVAFICFRFCSHVFVFVVVVIVCFAPTPEEAPDEWVHIRLSKQAESMRFIIKVNMSEFS